MPKPSLSVVVSLDDARKRLLPDLAPKPLTTKRETTETVQEKPVDWLVQDSRDSRLLGRVHSFQTAFFAREAAQRLWPNVPRKYFRFIPVLSQRLPPKGERVVPGTIDNRKHKQTKVKSHGKKSSNKRKR